MRLARSRVRSLEGRELNPTPLPFEFSEERSFLTSKTVRPAGLFYDGGCWVTIHSELIQSDEKNLEHCHIVFTDQVLLVWTKSAARYQVIVPVLGFPGFISVAGVIDGSTKQERSCAGQRSGVELTGRAKNLAEEYLGNGWRRTEEIVKGYVLQILFYHITGRPFRKNPYKTNDVEGMLATGSDLSSVKMAGA
jgi:hypothetical protein